MSWAWNNPAEQSPSPSSVEARDPPGPSKRSTATMGKKSKKKAKAGATSPPALTGGTGTALATSGKASATKNVRCFECLKTVKISEGKGHQCSGCLQIYCWMCEEKMFKTCPNGSRCVHPCRRCHKCTSGRSMFKAMKGMGISAEIEGAHGTRALVDAHAVDKFCDAVTDGEEYTQDIIPMQMCFKQADGLCNGAECFYCLNDKEIHQLLQCVDCRVVKCLQCASVDEKSANRFDTAINQLRKGTDWEITADDVCEMYEVVKADVMFPCGDCGQHRCLKCISSQTLRGIAKRCSALGKGTSYQDIPLVCNTCYYTKKPCTNPTCPNPVGVPTKRCGGCHISRYCSKECQALDFPDHIEKCEKMQQKLATKAGKTMIK